MHWSYMMVMQTDEWVDGFMNGSMVRCSVRWGAWKNGWVMAR